MFQPSYHSIKILITSAFLYYPLVGIAGPDCGNGGDTPSSASGLDQEHDIHIVNQSDKPVRVAIGAIASRDHAEILENDGWREIKPKSAGSVILSVKNSQRQAHYVRIDCVTPQRTITRDERTFCGTNKGDYFNSEENLTTHQIRLVTWYRQPDGCLYWYPSMGQTCASAGGILLNGFESVSLSADAPTEYIIPADACSDEST